MVDSSFLKGYSSCIKYTTNTKVVTMNQEELISYLKRINFTKLEAQIYLALLEGGAMSAYQLAKKIDISRPSIYNTLEHMYEKGNVELIPENTALYVAQDPKVLLKKLNSEFLSNTDLLSEGLNGFLETRHEERYVNFKGYDTTIFKAKELIQSADQEVYMNADFDLSIFKEEITILRSKGIKVIGFSFQEMKLEELDMEFYSHDRKPMLDHKPSRLMIAVDKTKALLADCYKERGTWLGTVTNNALMVSIVSEHIHNDIYLLKFKNKYGSKIYNDELYINSTFEHKARMENK